MKNQLKTCVENFLRSKLAEFYLKGTKKKKKQNKKQKKKQNQKQPKQTKKSQLSAI